MSTYLEKYLKYKTKYLKNKTMSGGATAFFKNNTVLYILANPTNPDLIKAYDDRIKLLLPNGKAKNKPHITIYQLNINQDHPAAIHFQDPAFIREVRRLYDKSFNNVTLTSEHGKYTMYGSGKDFYVRLYQSDNQLSITDFRKGIYDYIKTHFNAKYTGNQDEIKNNETFVVNYFDNIPFYAISKDKHYGQGKWSPHMSIIDSSDLENFKNSNPKAYNNLYGPKYERLTQDDKAKYLTHIIHEYGDPAKNPALQGQVIAKMVNIKILQDLSIITYSLHNGRAKIHVDVNM